MEQEIECDADFHFNQCFQVDCYIQLDNKIKNWTIPLKFIKAIGETFKREYSAAYKSDVSETYYQYILHIHHTAKPCKGASYEMEIGDGVITVPDWKAIIPNRKTVVIDAQKMLHDPY